MFFYLKAYNKKAKIILGYNIVLTFLNIDKIFFKDFTI